MFMFLLIIFAFDIDIILSIISIHMSNPVAPNQTLLIRNINNKFSNDEIKRQLYFLFSYVSPVLDIHVRRGELSRGKAWVSFPTIEISSNVMKAFNGFKFLGKEIQIEFARNRSKTLDEYYEEYKSTISNKNEEEDTKDTVKESNIIELRTVNAITSRIINILCNKRTGFKGIKDVPCESGGCFHVEFENKENAKESLEALNGFLLVDKTQITASFVVDS